VDRVVETRGRVEHGPRRGGGVLGGEKGDAPGPSLQSPLEPADGVTGGIAVGEISLISCGVADA
jgi:hypothetical protein